MDKIQFALKLAKDCTYADEMTEGAKQYLRNAIDEALNQALHLHSVMQAEGSDGEKGATVGQRSVDTVAEAQDFRHCYIRTKIGCHCTDECGYDALMRGISDEGQP